MKFSIDPRRGDIEDDASSPKSQSMLALAGSLLVELSFPKLIVAWIFLLILPGLALGLAPMIVSAWINMVSGKITSPFSGLWPASALVLLALAAWYGWRALFRLVETSFWSLASLVVQPAYTACREGVRHLVELFFPEGSTTASSRAQIRSVTSIVAGVVICCFSLIILHAIWPKAELFSDIREIGSFKQLITVALANSVVFVSGYLATGALIWAVADGTMDQPQDLESFDVAPTNGKTWRIAHLSDIHVVGERYGFRIESGRMGPQGNERLGRVLDQIERIDARQPLDTILITGDMTDAGRSAEWSEFTDLLAAHPRLADRILMIPGNHDLNIVDRANPARMELPTSPNPKLRQIRALNAIASLQGDRVRIVDYAKAKIGGTLNEAMAPHFVKLARFSDTARPFLFKDLSEIWNTLFPMVLPPDKEDGLGIILLNSNAPTHFSFTNALGTISAEQLRGIEITIAQYPRAGWIIALHHHVVEYPRAAKALSERVGTALINGNWFVRQLKPLANRAVLMHGHRHIDWIGRCANLVIVSAPSPVMEATDDLPTYFYVHTVAVTDTGRLMLLAPERVELPGDAVKRRQHHPTNSGY
jgi:Calcineurin-like phosphoesterase